MLNYLWNNWSNFVASVMVPQFRPFLIWQLLGIIKMMMGEFSRYDWNFCLSFFSSSVLFSSCHFFSLINPWWPKTSRKRTISLTRSSVLDGKFFFFFLYESACKDVLLVLSCFIVTRRTSLSLLSCPAQLAILTGKNCFAQFSTRMAASDLFCMFIKFCALNFMHCFMHFMQN